MWPSRWSLAAHKHGTTTATHRDATPRPASLRRNERVVKGDSHGRAPRVIHEPGSSHTMPATGTMSNARVFGFVRHACRTLAKRVAFASFTTIATTNGSR